MKSAVKAYVWAIVATLAIAAMLFALGTLIFQAGRTKERVVWVERESKAAAEFTKKFNAEVKRGREAVGTLQSDLQALHARYSTLEGSYRELSDRVPLVLPVAVGPRRADRGAAASADAGNRPTADPAAPGDIQPSDGGDRRLSLGAIWMWNSSLAGMDTPAHSCGLADTSSESCAPDSGLTVEDAWANQHLNAKSCAADRIRHRALIEFLTEQRAAE